MKGRNNMFTYSKFGYNYHNMYYKYDERLSDDYSVTVNGEEVPVYTCRISKYPFNRAWPGYQRSATQTDVVSFVNIISDEKLDFKVKVKFPYEKIMIRPYSKEISYMDNDGEVSFTIENEGGYVFAPDDFHHTLYIFNSKPVESPKEDEVTYYFGPGVHMPGKITLHDNESVYVDKDALVFGCVYAENAENLHIFGNGLFDDASEGRVDGRCYENTTNGNIKFYDCKNVRVEGVLFRDSACWCVNIFHCEGVLIDNIKVFGQWRYNTDGVDIVNSRDITVKNSFIHSFDDTISIKGIEEYMEYDVENILVENCILWCDWGNTCEVGIETLCRSYKNITFRNSDIMKGGFSALDVNNGNTAEISDVVFENLNVEYNAFDTEPVTQTEEDMVYPNPEGIWAPKLIRIRNVDMVKIYPTVQPYTKDIDMTGVRQGDIHNVTIRNIKVYYDEEIPKTDGKYNTLIYINNLRDNAEISDITISGITVNGVALDKENALLDIGDIKNFTFKR